MKKFLFLLSFLSLFFVIGCGNDEPISKVPYEVIKSEKAGANRLKISIHVKEKVSKDQLQKLADQVFMDQKKTAPPFTALFINFYDNPIYVGQFTPSLGQADFLPNGDIATAATAKPGEYKNFKGVYGELKEKDWKKQPTPEEAKIATDCLAWLRQQPPEKDGEDDREKIYAKNKNLDPVALKETLDKVLVWTSF